MTTSVQAAPAIEIRDLHKSFGSNKVLKGIDFHVDNGEVVCVIGPSGSGKSTLLRCIDLLEEIAGERNGATPSQIALYQEFRRAVDMSLDNMAKAEMLRHGGQDVAGLREAVMDEPDLETASDCPLPALRRSAS